MSGKAMALQGIGDVEEEGPSRLSLPGPIID
jgi:hypothetical protein